MTSLYLELESMAYQFINMKQALVYLSNLAECNEHEDLIALQEQILYLYQHQPEKLLWILYRLDVDEQKLHSHLTHGNAPDEVLITQLLLERCTQIIKTRGHVDFKSTKNWSFDLDD